MKQINTKNKQMKQIINDTLRKKIYCSMCHTEVLDKYGYCKKCRAKYQMDYYYKNKDKIEKYREKASQYIYFLVDIYGRILYIGSCSRIVERTNQHINCNSNLHISALEWQNVYKLSKILYVNVEMLTENNKQQREYLERLYIQKNTSLLGSNKPNPTLSVNTMERLEYYIDYLETDFVELEGLEEKIKYYIKINKEKEQKNKLTNIGVSVS